MARTWWDLAAELDIPDLVAAGDSALRSGLPREALTDMVHRMRGRRGNARAAKALDLTDHRSRSRPESHLRVALRVGGIHCLEVNQLITDAHGGWLAEPDLICREAKIALEYQGASHADPARMRRDITRETDLRRNGWLVVMYGPAEVFAHPWRIAPEVRTLIQRRAPGHLPGRKECDSRR